MMKKKSKTLPKAQREEYALWCAKYGIDPNTGKQFQAKKKEFTPLKVCKNPRTSVAKLPSIDSKVKGAIYSKSMMDPLQWRGESEETVKDIVAKSKSLVILYNKGAYQPITPGTDVTQIGSAERLRRGN